MIKSIPEKLMMAVFQNDLTRWMILSDKIPIKELTQIAGLTSIMDEVGKRKLKWFGYINEEASH